MNASTATDAAPSGQRTGRTQMRELRIANGTSFAPPLYGPESTLTRGQLMTFLVRAFFP